MKLNSKGILLLIPILVTIFFNNTQVYSQSRENAIAFSAGYIPEGFGFKASYDISNGISDFIQLSALGAFSEEIVQKEISIPYNNYLLNIDYFTPLVKSNNNSLAIFGGAGGSIGYENINNGEQELSNGSVLTSESGFVYGITASINFDVFLSDSLSLFMPVDGFYHFNSSMGNTLIFVGLGMKFYLN